MWCANVLLLRSFGPPPEVLPGDVMARVVGFAPAHRVVRVRP